MAHMKDGESKFATFQKSENFSDIYTSPNMHRHMNFAKNVTQHSENVGNRPFPQFLENQKLECIYIH